MVAKGDWDFRIPVLVKNRIELIFKPYDEFRWSPESAVSHIHSPHLHAGVPGIFSDLLRSVQMLKREWGAENNGKLPHLSIPSKTAAWVSEFAVEDLALSRTAALVPEFAVKDLPMGRILWWFEKPFFNKLKTALKIICQGVNFLNLSFREISSWGYIGFLVMTEGYNFIESVKTSAISYRKVTSSYRDAWKQRCFVILFDLHFISFLLF